MIDRKHIESIFRTWCGKLRVTPSWNVRLEWVEDPAWHKTGDIKIDVSDHKAIVLLNGADPKQENLEEVVAHELLHLKLYPLDQTTESLINASFKEDSPAWRFAMEQFMTTLEVTVEELTKCFLLDSGENRELSFGRCSRGKTFDELFDGLSDLE